jgi:hypothetical protein
VPASITISVSGNKVAAGGTVSVFGHLATSSGAPVAHHRVWLLERLDGQDAVSEVAMGLTGADGSIVLTSPVLTHSARLRLVAGQGTRSAALNVVVEPSVTATVTAEGSTYSVLVATDGGSPGDTVLLQRRMNGGWQAMATAELDGSARATFSVPVPSKRTFRYRVILPRTQEHGYGETRFATPPA